MRLLLLPLLAFAALPSLPSLPWDLHLPVWAERWLYNPRERMERSIEAQAKGRPRDAAKTAETALRLAPDDPLVQYGAGTARLNAGSARQAVPLLEKAAKSASPGMAPAAHYNLGNARLAAGDASGAVEAFKKVLRTEPGNLNAKHNLELALREEQKQKMGLKGRPPGSRGNRSQNEDPSNRQGKGKHDPKPGPQQGDGQPQPGEARPQPSRNGSQQFRNQPEMSAREAASVLSAVENLERQQRRDQAARRARQRPAKGKDW